MLPFKEFKENHFRPGLFLFSIILSIVMLVAAKWQWTRYHEKLILVQTFQGHLSENSIKLSAKSLEKDSLKELVNKRIQVEGEFDFSNQLIIGNKRSKYGAGSWILTPLRISDSEKSILVSRGFIPFEDRDEKSWEKYTPSELLNRKVIVQGVLYQTTEKRSAFSPTAKTEKPNIYLYPDLKLISEQIPVKIYEDFLIQGIMEPVTSEFPMTDIKIDVPPSTHFWYTFEWIILAFMTQLIAFLVQLFRPLKRHPRPTK